MADIYLQHLADSQKGGSLYQSTYRKSTTDQTYSFYYLTLATARDKQPISFSHIWNRLTGALIFLPFESKIVDKANFIDTLLVKLQLETDEKWIGWIDVPNKIILDDLSYIRLKQVEDTTPYFTFEVVEMSLPLNSFEVIIPKHSLVTLSLEIPMGISIGKNPNQTPCSLKGISNQTEIEISGKQLFIPLNNRTMGTLQFKMHPNRMKFYSLFAETTGRKAPAAEMRYTFGGLDQLATIRYPIVEEKISTSSNNPIALKTSLDPLQLVDGQRTYFSIITSLSQASIVCPFYATNLGQKFYLIATNAGGFAFSWRYESKTKNKILYLVPNGTYTIQIPGNTEKQIQLMCGIVGTEFLLVSENDSIEFTNGYFPAAQTYPSHAPNFYAIENKTTSTIGLLDTEGSTTAWVKVKPQYSSRNNLNAIYCVQSLGATFYHPTEGNFYEGIIGCRISDLANNDQPAFPMTPFKGVFDRGNGQSPNPSVITGKLLENFEQKVISPNRNRQILRDLTLGPLFFNMKNNKPLVGGYIRTGKGMLVALNDGSSDSEPAGTLKNLVLAKSPINEGQLLQVNSTLISSGNKIINPYFSFALMENAPFVVMTKDIFGESFLSKLQMGEFTFNLDLSNNGNVPIEDQTIIIFKLGKGQSVVDLSKSTANWTNPNYFIGGEASNLATHLQCLFSKDCSKHTETIFEDFYTKVNDANWTGMLALNCSLDYAALPIDLQMLLGGIKGKLKAHHFGINLNHLNQKEKEVTINNSSLFALVHYSEALDTAAIEAKPKETHFQVLKLNALFKNSSLAHFDSKIAMVLPQLFEEKVKLTKNNASSSFNVLAINGVYQKPTDPNKQVGKVVFFSDKLFVFDFKQGEELRVIDKIVINSAALNPVKRTKDSAGNIEVISHFDMRGGLGFTPSIGPDPNTLWSEVDLFSFAIDEEYDKKGLQLSGYNLALKTTIKKDSSASLAKIVTEYKDIRIGLVKNKKSPAARKDSFFDNLPLQFTGFQYDLSNGISAKSVNGQQMQMDEEGKSAFSGVLKDVQPNFAFTFKLNLGSRGTLVAKDNIIEINLLIGWQKSSSTQKNQQVAMIFVPPQTSIGGNLYIQGIFGTKHGPVFLDRYPTAKTPHSDLIFVITLRDIDFFIFGTPLMPQRTGWQRALTFFGDPTDEDKKISWFMGNPSHKLKYDPDNRRIEDLSISVTPFWGNMQGLILKSSPTNIDVVSPVISNLIKLPSSTRVMVTNIASGEARSTVWAYDPMAGIMTWIDLDLIPFSLKVLMDDYSKLFGAVLKLAPPEKKEQTPEGTDHPETTFSPIANQLIEGDDSLGPWKGMKMVLVYRKINDKIGVLSGRYKRPKEENSASIGKYGVTLPSIGLSIYTGGIGGFKLTVGWPLDSATPLKISFPDPSPYTIFGGFYIAALSSEVSPEEFGTGFGAIFMGGIGLGLTYGTKEEKGVFTSELDITGTFTVEFLSASKDGGTMNYHWTVLQLAVSATASISLEYKFIQAELEIEVSITLVLAFETGHQTVFEIEVEVTAKLVIKLVLLKISFHFKYSRTLYSYAPTDNRCPDGTLKKTASTSAPSIPTACGYKPKPNRLVKIAATKIEEAIILEEFITAPTCHLDLFFGIQATAAAGSSAAIFQPYGITSLFINAEVDAAFTQLTKALGIHAFNRYNGAASDFKTQIQNIQQKLPEFASSIKQVLSDGFIFTIQPMDKIGEAIPTVAIFPMLPGLAVKYKGETLEHEALLVTPSYAQTIEAYFENLAKHSKKSELSTNEPILSVIQQVFEHYFEMVTKSLFEAILDLIDQSDAAVAPKNMTEAYAQLSQEKEKGHTAFTNISGLVSRNMLHGPQLPDPNAGNQLKSLYSLTNQQVLLEKNETTGEYFRTFEVTKGTTSSWVKLSATTIKEELDEKLILKNIDQINTKWLDALKELKALNHFTKLFPLNHSLSWVDDKNQQFNLRSITTNLTHYIDHQISNGSGYNLLVAKRLPEHSGTNVVAETLPTASIIPSLLIAIKLKQIPKIGTSGEMEETIFQLEGTDEITRNKIQLLLNTCQNQSAKINRLNLLVAPSNGKFQSIGSENPSLIYRTNLSTDSIPEGVNFSDLLSQDGLHAHSPLGPIKATLAEAEDFLRLIWELSIVHTKGFFLKFKKKIDQTLFTRGEASISLLVELGTTFTEEQMLEPYHNMLILDKQNLTCGIGAYLKNSASKALQAYAPNYAAGFAGFSVNYQTVQNPDITNSEEYLASIYHFIQYKIDACSWDVSFKATNWSKPMGAHSKTLENELLDWSFQQRIPIPKIMGLKNRYDKIGESITISARVLDMFGNAHPAIVSKQLNLRYNDALIGPGHWQGIHFYYEVQASTSGPQLKIVFNYLEEGIKADAAKLAEAIKNYELAYEQLTDRNVICSVQTTLAKTPIIKDKAGTNLKEVLTDFIQSILSFLKTTNGATPSDITIFAELDKNYIKTLPNDIFKLTASLNISRAISKVDPAIVKLYPAVQSIATIIVPHVADTSKSSNISLVTFAEAFEAAYKDFAGPNTSLKIAEGVEKMTASSIREIFGVRWGKQGGIYAEAPNNQASPIEKDRPNYFAPAPLNTVLRNEKFNQLYEYDDPTSGQPSKTNISRWFNNIDLDTWGSNFLTDYHSLLSPEMAGAIAKLSSAGKETNYYQRLINVKEELAQQIKEDVQYIINFPDRSKEATEAKRVFEQALLASLTKDYDTSVIVQIPIKVSIQGNTAKHPPRLYGKILPNLQSEEIVQNFTISNGSLTAENSTEQLAFMIDAKRPKNDSFLNFDHLYFDIGFIEYKFNDNETHFGFTPSSWLSFVLPNDEALQVDLGSIKAPIPLRQFPESPVLVAQSQIPSETPPQSIPESLNWGYQLVVGKPEAEQDELMLSLAFNQPLTKGKLSEKNEEIATRPVPSNLEEALARFSYEYPQLAPELPDIILAAKGQGTLTPEKAQAILSQIISLAEGIGEKWQQRPKHPGCVAHQKLHSDESFGTVYEWNYSIMNKFSNNQLILTRGDSSAIWPEILGYSLPSVSGNIATYTKVNKTDINQLTFRFNQLFILTHQSVNVSTYIVRNEDLAYDDGKINSNFIYTTDAVSFPTPIVPINQNINAIGLNNGTSLAEKFEALFLLFSSDPYDKSKKISQLKFHLNLDATFVIAKAKQGESNNIKAQLPILLSAQEIDYNAELSMEINGNTVPLKQYIQNIISGIPEEVKEKSPAYFIQMIVFSNVSDDQLPLVTYRRINLGEVN